MSKKKKLIPYTEQFDYAVDDLMDRNAFPETKDPHVGVELEFLSPLDHRAIAAQLIMNGITEGVEIKDDGSLRGLKGARNDTELCIIAKQSEIVSKVTKICKILKSVGCRVNNSCGLHVHLDMRKRNRVDAFKNLVEELPKLTKMVKKNRLNNHFCKLNKTKELDKVLKGETNYEFDYEFEGEQIENPVEDYELIRYLAINPWSLEKHDTIEVRLHEGSLDSKKINKWIKKLVKTADRKVA